MLCLVFRVYYSVCSYCISSCETVASLSLKHTCIEEFSHRPTDLPVFTPCRFHWQLANKIEREKKRKNEQNEAMQVENSDSSDPNYKSV